MSNKIEQLQTDINELRKQLSEYQNKFTRVQRDYDDLLCNLDDDNLSAALLNQKGRFQKLYERFDIDIDNYTFNGDVHTVNQNGKTLTNISGKQIQIFDLTLEPEMMFGIASAELENGQTSKAPIIMLGSGEDDRYGNSNGQLIIIKNNYSGENGENFSYALLNFLTADKKYVSLQFGHNDSESAEDVLTIKGGVLRIESSETVFAGGTVTGLGIDEISDRISTLEKKIEALSGNSEVQ